MSDRFSKPPPVPESDVPPAFPPIPSTAGEPSRNQKGLGRRLIVRISTKKSRPQSYTPLPQSPPPKALPMSQNSHKEAPINGISSTSLRRSREQIHNASQVEAKYSRVNTSPSLHHKTTQMKAPQVSVEKNQARANIVVQDDDDDAPIGNETTSQSTDPNILPGTSRSSSDADKNIINTLQDIKKMYGDITRDYSLESDSIKTFVVYTICKVVVELQNKQLKDLNITTLDNHYKVVKDAENMKVNVQWLRIRLDEIRDAIALTDEVKGAMNEKKRRVEIISRKEKEVSLRKLELERLKCEIQDIEDQLAEEVVMVRRLNENIRAQLSKIQKFQVKNLMDGLV